MRILFLNDILEGGGAERAMATLINTLVKKHQLSIQLALLEKGVGFKLEDEVKVHFLSSKKLPPNYEKFKNLWTQARLLKKIIQQEKIDLVISFQFRSNFTAIISRIFGHSAKIILSERAYAKNFYNRPGIAPMVNQFLMRMLYPKADLIIANSRDIKIGLSEFYGVSKKLIKVINNGYSLEEIWKLSQEEIPEWNRLFDREDKVIINVGRVEWEKGQEYLLEAMTFLPRDLPIKLLLLGKVRPEYKQKLDLIIEKHNLHDRVFFKGFTSNPYPWIAKSSIFVFTSLFEGYPNAVAEALILEKPIVSFDIKAGVRDIIISEKQGVLVPFGNTEVLAESILKSLKPFVPDSSHILSAEESALKYFQYFKQTLN
jgi:N-acetylgalactosamine-N,N'-diacetylbacillosaminyl-diphospho-undecaprenol 4-alpha-N-acetylgalactosaminyltransferase